MSFFTFLSKRNGPCILIFVLWVSFIWGGILHAQTATNAASPVASAIETNAAPANVTITLTNTPGEAAATNTPPVAPPASVTTPVENPAPVFTSSLPAKDTNELSKTTFVGRAVEPPVFGSLLVLLSVIGFLFYQCGLARAKNCGHTSALLLVGLVFGLIGYWAGGFAVQMGGIGDAHAALIDPDLAAQKPGLDHELGVRLLGHPWGFMGSAGFFLIADETNRSGMASLFLAQAALLALAVAAALGAALERGRLLAMAIVAFLAGAVIYPLFANWVWGGGWLAELGRESGLGHGFVDLAGAGVIHEAAGTLALVIAVTLGPRYGKFGRNHSINAIPGHNMPFLFLGTLVLLVSWTALNAFAYAAPAIAPEMPRSSAGIAAVNALLGAAGGFLASFLLAAKRKQAPQPALLCRGLLGGTVSVFACAALIDPWAAFVIGLVAGGIVQFAFNRVEQRRIDDPAGAISVHGAAGAWGVLAAGLFANGTAGDGINGVTGPVRGLLITGDWHQLVAQIGGGVTCFVIVFILGYACLSLIQKILGNRVELADEVHGLDWTQTGALGYQGDIEPEELPRGESDKEKAIPQDKAPAAK